MWGAQTAGKIVGGAAVTATTSAIGVSSGVAGAATPATLAVAHLATLAGVTTTVPVVGWVIAGGLAAAAGTIGLVHAIRTGKANRAEALGYARANGIPETSPKLIVHALKKGSAWRLKEARKLSKGHVSRKDRSKLAILAAVDLSERAAARGKLEPSAHPDMLAAEHGSSAGLSPVASWTIAGGVVLLVAIGATLQRRRRRPGA